MGNAGQWSSINEMHQHRREGDIRGCLLKALNNGGVLIMHAEDADIYDSPCD